MFCCATKQILSAYLSIVGQIPTKTNSLVHISTTPKHPTVNREDPDKQITNWFSRISAKHPWTATRMEIISIQFNSTWELNLTKDLQEKGEKK